MSGGFRKIRLKRSRVASASIFVPGSVTATKFSPGFSFTLPT